MPPAFLFAVPPAFGLVGPLSEAPPPDPPFSPTVAAGSPPPPPPPSEVMVEKVEAEPFFPAESVV